MFSAMMEKRSTYVAFEGETCEYTYTKYEGAILCQKHGGVIENKFEIMNWQGKNYIVCPCCSSFIPEEEYVLLREYPIPPRI